MGSGEGDSHGSPTPTQISQRGSSEYNKTITCLPDRRALGLAYSHGNLVKGKNTRCLLSAICRRDWGVIIIGWPVYMGLSGLFWIRTIAIKVTLPKLAQLPQSCSHERNMCECVCVCFMLYLFHSGPVSGTGRMVRCLNQELSEGFI